jgi:Holliday junction DNA helicase RuvA
MAPLLVSVQGVGAKASMAILGTLGAEGVARAVALGDWGSVRAAQGVGPKLAQRVVNELKDKAPRPWRWAAIWAASDLVTPDPGPDRPRPARCHPVRRRPRRSRPCRTSATPRRCGPRGGGGGRHRAGGPDARADPAALRLLAPKE